MTVISIVVGILGTVTKGLVKGLKDLEIGGQVETIQTRALLKSFRMLKRVLETWGDLLSLKLLWMTFLTNGIQALQHQWKKCEDRKDDFVEK